MARHGIVLSLALIAMTAMSPALRCGVLGTATFSIDEANFCQGTNQPRIVLSAHVLKYIPGYGWNSGCETYCRTWLDSTEVDTILAVSIAACDSCIVRTLTDGETDGIGLGFWLPGNNCSDCYAGYGTWKIVQEAFALSHPDFRGAVITSLSLRLDDLDFMLEPGQNCVIIHVRSRVTMIVEGVPIATEATTWGRIKQLYEN